MGLSCYCGEYDGDGWAWISHDEYSVYKGKRRKRCCSCKDFIDVGALSLRFDRLRGPKDFIEERIHGDEVYLSPWFMCETCADLFFSLDELGFCITLGIDSMRDLVKEYAKQYQPGAASDDQ